MMRKDMKNMEDVMDRLTLEHKQIPIYMENIYRLMPQLSTLKQKNSSYISILENLKCPYCSNEDNSCDLFYDNEIFIYVDPEGYLRFGTSEGVGSIEIQFCLMCGRQLK